MSVYSHARYLPRCGRYFVRPSTSSACSKIAFSPALLRRALQLKIRCNLDAIVFRNFYCSHITIKQRRKLGQATGGEVDDNPWVTVLRDRPLMEDPHYEDDAQYWHVITTKEFDMSAYDAESTSPLRWVIARHRALIRRDAPQILTLSRSSSL